jgi:hypothetical protein
VTYTALGDLKERGNSMHTLKSVAILILVCASATLLTACTTTIPEANPNLLAFLAEGRTTRAEIIVTLGRPSGCYQQEQILTYRLGDDSKQGYYIVERNPVRPSVWSNKMRYSLVLLLDDQGFLKKHSLVSVK